MVYEYANRLAEEHDVTLVHPDILIKGAEWKTYPARFIGWTLRQARLSYGPGQWFPIDPRVRVLTVSSLHPRHIPDGDIVVATAWPTAEWVAGYPPSNGHKVYLVQDYEHFMSAGRSIRNRMMRTYQGPFKLIVISPVLQDLLKSHNIISTLIPNALDTTLFHCMNALSAEDRPLVGFPYRTEPYKGVSDIIDAMTPLIEPYGLAGRIWAFGSSPHPSLPQWVTYYQGASDSRLVTLYNQTKIFVVGSHFEGWGLPGMEAMACGAALVSTDNGGVQSYATHNINALLSSVRDPEALRTHIELLLKDEEKRIQLAREGLKVQSRFTWERSSHDLSRFLENTRLTEE